MEQCQDMTHGLMSHWGVGPEAEPGLIAALWTGRSVLLPILGRNRNTDTKRETPPPRLSTVWNFYCEISNEKWN